jgi:hypothetical protein
VDSGASGIARPTRDAAEEYLIDQTDSPARAPQPHHATERGRELPLLDQEARPTLRLGGETLCQVNRQGLVRFPRKRAFR